MRRFKLSCEEVVWRGMFMIFGCFMYFILGIRYRDEEFVLDIVVLVEVMERRVKELS